MKVELKDWVRTKYYIGKVRQFDNTNIQISHLKGYDICQYDNIIKVADTPQGLIQKKDLVTNEFLGYFVEVLAVNKNGSLLTNEYNDGQYIYKKDVTKILRPNSRGGFDLQWEES